MKLSALIGLATAQEYYYSQEFVNVANYLPGTGIIIGGDHSYRPMELMWLNRLREVNPGICDLNIVVLEQPVNINEPQKRNLGDYAYYFIMQVVYKNAMPETNDIMEIFPEASLPGSADYEDAIERHPDLEFPDNFPLHGTCEDSERECRYFEVETLGCFDTHQEYFDPSDPEALAMASANITQTFQDEMETFVMDTTLDFYPYFVRSLQFDITSITDRDITYSTIVKASDFDKPGLGDGTMISGDTVFKNIVKENLYEVCFTHTTQFKEVAFEAIKDETEWGLFAVDYPETLMNYVFNSQTTSYEYMCVAPDCEPVSNPCECTEGITNAMVKTEKALNKWSKLQPRFQSKTGSIWSIASSAAAGLDQYQQYLVFSRKTCRQVVLNMFQTPEFGFDMLERRGTGTKSGPDNKNYQAFDGVYYRSKDEENRDHRSITFGFNTNKLQPDTTGNSKKDVYLLHLNYDLPDTATYVDIYNCLQGAKPVTIDTSVGGVNPDCNYSNCVGEEVKVGY